MILFVSLLCGIQCQWISFNSSNLRLPFDIDPTLFNCNRFLAHITNNGEFFSEPQAVEVSKTLLNCPFALDMNAMCGINELSWQCKKGNSNIEWQCSIFNSALCDGYSQCLTDECGCEEDSFRCADGLGCIALRNVCDGYKDCRDSSDECMCEDIVTCHNGVEQYCIPKDKYLATKTLHKYCEEPQGLDGTEKYSISVGNQIEECLSKLSKIYKWPVIPEEIVKWTSSNCNVSKTHFFDNIYQDFTGKMVFYCKIKGGKLEPTKICDGTTDCDDGTDEHNCPGRYYCKDTERKANNTFFWVDRSLVCNMHKDCPLGDDECQDCLSSKRGMGVASDDQMIKNMSIKVLIIVECVLIISLNMIAAWDISTKDVGSKSAKVDRLAILSLCIYDTLMGVYLGYIFTKSIMFSGKYCLNDHNWRLGLQCKGLGVLFTFSAHGSLLMISMISITRCCKCVLDKEISLRMALLVLLLLHLTNMAHSILPILPLSSVQDVFRAYMSFSENPFFKEYAAKELVRKYQVYYGENATISSTYAMLEQLNNVTTKGHMFDPQELSYYSYSALCIHNIYSHQDALMIYMIPYMISIVIILTATSASYISIVRHAYKLSRNVNQLAANGNRALDTNKDLSVKVMLIIGSQLACWITVMILTIIFSYFLVAPQLLYELTAVIFFPLNSYLNPIFNSFLYKMVVAKIDAMIKCVAKINKSKENERGEDNST